MFVKNVKLRVLFLIAALAAPGALIALSRADLGRANPPTDATPLSDEDADQHVADSIERLKEFAIKEWPTLGLQLRDLPRTVWLASYFAEYETLEDAARAARLVVHINVQDVTFNGSGAVTTATVLDSWKGDVSGQLMFAQNGSVFRSPDGVVYIIEAEVAPLLIPGDEAVVFLRDPKKGDVDLPQVIIVTGWYKVANGRVSEVAEGLSSVRELVGVSLEDLRSRVDLALK